MTTKVFGFELLQRQIVEHVRQRVETIEEWGSAGTGDTPIERLFYVALFAYLEVAYIEFRGRLRLVSDHSRIDEVLNTFARHDELVIQSQVQLDDWRVDFLVHAWTDGRVWRPEVGPERGPPRWRKLIVECDGHDFHERTKEQAARDRSRDRRYVESGYDVFRFTGSELWADPLGCAVQVYEWAARGVA